eukprot:s1032_g18.t1
MNLGIIPHGRCDKEALDVPPDADEASASPDILDHGSFRSPSKLLTKAHQGAAVGSSATSADSTALAALPVKTRKCPPEQISKAPFPMAQHEVCRFHCTGSPSSGNLDAVKLLLERGADVTVKDGQAGAAEQLGVLLDAVEKEWPDNSWNNFRNRKGQDVVEAARVNRKGQVVDFLCERLGIDVETVKSPAPAAPAGSAESSEAARARAALLAAAGAEQAPDASAATPEERCAGNASAMRAALDKLKSNPEAVEQAKKMMGNMPPQMLQMLTGGKVSEEQAKKVWASWETFGFSETDQ